MLDEFPVANSALCILLGLCGVIEREFDVVKSAQFVIFQNGHAVPIRSDGEFDGPRAQVGEYCLEVRMHAVLTCAEIHRAYGQAFHNCLHLLQGETVRASWIAVAEGAGEIALVGEAEPERNSGLRRYHVACGR